VRIVGHTGGTSVQIKQIEIYQAMLGPELNVVRDGATLVLSWASLPGYQYQFLSTTNLGAGNWTTNTTLSGTGLWLTNTMPIGSEPQKFFRLQVEPN
jgi:hypothetical protein